MNLFPLLFILLLILFIYNNCEKKESKDLNLNIDNCKCN